jgi:putative protease
VEAGLTNQVEAARARVELLAPAGGPDAGLAALQSGADAIYLGLKRFSARADADNFSPEELEEITAYAHALAPRRRVFAAVNTLVLDGEVGAAVEALAALAEAGVDAVIVQDLGVARLARRYFPQLALHASTQLAVHSRAGVEALRSLGFARATLARELTVDEVADAASVQGIEVEAFIHGALCYAYSGLCLFSSQHVGRSGNRGACAYPCRDEWRVGAVVERVGAAPSEGPPPGGFAFSMKDLAAPDHLGALRKAGVASLKIEGRKKSALYVAAAVSYYRALLDGGLSESERAAREEDLRTIFSRPWTPLFLGSRHDKDVVDRDFVGHRGARIGEVEAVVRSGRDVFVRFRSGRALGRHDGLQIEIPGQGRPFGFPVDVLRLASAEPRGRSREVTQAPAGSVVEVGLPEGYPTIPVGAAISCSSSQAVKEGYRLEKINLAAYRRRAPLRIEARLVRDELAVEATAEDEGGGEKAQASASLAGPFEAAKDPSRTAASLRAAFEKLGDTRLRLASFELEDPLGLFVPVSRVNELRRGLAAQVDEKLRALRADRLRRITSEMALAPAEAPPAGALRWSVMVDRVSSLSSLAAEDLDGIDEVVVEIARDSGVALLEALRPLADRLGHEHIRLALPSIARGWEEPGLKGKVGRLREAGFARWQAANVAAWSTLGIERGRPAGIDLAADWSMYAVNRQAARELLEMGAGRVTLSVEDGLANMALLARELGERATVVVYQDTPLFISESCPYANLKGGCPGISSCRYESMELRSSRHEEVLAINERCRAVVIDRDPLCLAGRLPALERAGVRRVRADFIHRPYAPEEVRDIWRALRSGLGIKRGRLANFDRGLDGSRAP